MAKQKKTKDLIKELKEKRQVRIQAGFKNTDDVKKKREVQSLTNDDSIYIDGELVNLKDIQGIDPNQDFIRVDDNLQKESNQDLLSTQTQTQETPTIETTIKQPTAPIEKNIGEDFESQIKKESALREIDLLNQQPQNIPGINTETQEPIQQQPTITTPGIIQPSTPESTPPPFIDPDSLDLEKLQEQYHGQQINKAAGFEQKPENFILNIDQKTKEKQEDDIIDLTADFIENKKYRDSKNYFIERKKFDQYLEDLSNGLIPERVVEIAEDDRINNLIDEEERIKGAELFIKSFTTSLYDNIKNMKSGAETYSDISTGINTFKEDGKEPEFITKWKNEVNNSFKEQLLPEFNESFFTSFPDFIDTWTRQLGQQIPNMLLAAAGPAGIVSMIMQETGNFKRQSEQYGIDPDISNAAALMYGMGSGLSEYIENIINIGPLKKYIGSSEKLRKAAKKHF
jgi:hypothetical protein